MIVAVICDVLGAENNGTTIAAMNLIRALRAKGHTVRVVCPDEDRKGEPDTYVLPVLHIGSALDGYIAKNGVSLARIDEDILRSAIADAAVVHILLPFFIGQSALHIARKAGKPVTASFHCQAENLTNHLRLMNSSLANQGVYRIFYNTFYKHCDCVHYPTGFIREVFEKAGGKTNAYVISNGVNSAFRKKEAVKPPEMKGRFVILFTGRYSLEKSHRVLMDGVRKSSYAENIQLVFAGSGPLREKLAQYAAENLPVQPIFRFYSREEMIDIINCADLYVHPAQIEIEAISCLEAISCGLVPVISDSPRSATRFFALTENNRFRCNDPDDLAQKIDWWIGHPQEKAACSRAYQSYTRQFDQGICMERMEGMLYDAISIRKAERGDAPRIALSRCVFPVPDVRSTAAWYERFLGFHAVHSAFGTQGDICLRLDDAEIVLTDSGGKAARTCRELYGHGCDASFSVFRLDGMQEEIASRGAKIVRRFSEADGDSHEFVVEDCDGRLLSFGQRQK